jgi:hypothetical protein
VRKLAIAVDQRKQAPAVYLGEHARVAQAILVLAERQPVDRAGPDGVDVISAGRSPSTSSITIVSGITKGSVTNSLTAHRRSTALIGFAVDRDSAGSSITTVAPPDEAQRSFRRLG